MTTGTTARAEAVERAARPAKGPGRITALDVARGAFLILSVTSVSFITPRPAPLIHAPWIGIRYVDLIFPLFVSLSGIGLAFAYRNHTPLLITMRRISVLIVTGLIYNAVVQGSWSWDGLEVTGPLQMYAALVAMISILHLVFRSWRAWAVLTLATAVLLAVAFAWYAARCPGLSISPTCNPSRVLDTRLFGTHMYGGGRPGHDPSGVIAIAGAFLTAAVGTTAGHLALESRRAQWHLGPRRLLAWAAVVFVTGFALTSLVPAFKRLWTPSFALMSAALGIVIFSVAFQAFDVPARPTWQRVRERLAQPLVALGRNSLLVYFGSHLLVVVMARGGPPHSTAHRLQESLSLGTGSRWGFVILMLAFWWGLALILHRRRIYIHT
ncbi:MAG TPA: heparan-alpha-glucosaminide N-acetyltransferase [Intrasporangiaceae bacterium]|nr:heparan-alpha-glucosaminide N-acetyltransferase [Intrasporangiaceae bacterium]